MSVRRSLGVLFAAGLVAGVVAGCEKQPPYASLFSGGDTATGEARAWCFDDGTITDTHLGSDCVSGPRLTGTLTVRPGDSVAIDVPPSVADDGWAANLLTDAEGGNATSVPGVTKGESYVQFTVPENIKAERYLLEVIALRPGEDSDTARGVWTFRLDVRNGD